MSSVLSSSLLNKQQLSWQQFCSQHPQASQRLIESLEDAELVHFKQAIMLSDFILISALQAPDLVTELFVSKDVYCQRLPDYQQLLTELLTSCVDENQLHRILRRFRLQQMVKIAVADLLLDIELEKSLQRLSSLADAFIVTSISWLSSFCEKQWGTPYNEQGVKQYLLVFGMGKLGGNELNFSSDIDLIFTYPEAGTTHGVRRSIENQQFFTRLGQKLISALHQQTADGFVYRVDMRLRPFGESGPLVMSFNAMEDYYQEQGRDWERYAMLKARLIGNSPFHQELTTLLRPFVYRRYIDFSVIDSLRRMKMMISQEVRRKQLVDNIKLGAGGIREIEFIVQVFQLIRGGRIKALQERHLLAVLPELVKAEAINTSSELILKNAYCFLRRVENILQALADKQTQTLPSIDNKLDKARLLYVMKFSCWDKFYARLNEHMQLVHDEFNLLIGQENPHHQTADEHWVTLWHSRWSDEESIAWIKQESENSFLINDWLVEKVWNTLANFREILNKRSLGNRGRQTIDKLVPLIIYHAKRQKNSEQVLERVFHVLEKIITRTAYLELLYENEGALKQLIHLCQASSWVTEYIAKYPILLDELIDPKLLHNPPSLSSYRESLREAMLRIPEDDLEMQMENLRQFKQAQQLRIAAADISKVLSIRQVSDHLTALAEAIAAEVINMAWQQVSQRFGVPVSCVESLDKGFAVIAYGKTGGRELGYSSDLDLVFLHNSDAHELTTGENDSNAHSKVVSANQFYLKLAQRIMHIFNSRMNSGILYELDMRLRPSGNSGVLVIHVDTFAQYQFEEAWTWEHQALVRARIIYGNSILKDKFKQIRQQVLSQKRDEEQLKMDVINMRMKMRKHFDKSTSEIFDIKQGVGGLVDIEFLAQYLVLKYCHQYPELNQCNDNVGIFKQLYQINILSQMQQDDLVRFYDELREIAHKAMLQNKDGTVELQSLDAEKLSKIKVIFQQYLY